MLTAKGKYRKTIRRSAFVFVDCGEGIGAGTGKDGA